MTHMKERLDRRVAGMSDAAKITLSLGLVVASAGRPRLCLRYR